MLDLREAGAMLWPAVDRAGWRLTELDRVENHQFDFHAVQFNHDHG